jgi:hypothetical protein
MATVREDEHGLYILINGARSRPGKISGYDHVYDMSDGGLKKGDKVKAYKQNGNQITTITLDGGKKIHWSSYPLDDPYRLHAQLSVEEKIKLRDSAQADLAALGLRIMKVR